MKSLKNFKSAAFLAGWCVFLGFMIYWLANCARYLLFSVDPLTCLFAIQIGTGGMVLSLGILLIVYQAFENRRFLRRFRKAKRIKTMREDKRARKRLEKKGERT